jgi:hypothetical protein
MPSEVEMLASVRDLLNDRTRAALSRRDSTTHGGRPNEFGAGAHNSEEFHVDQARTMCEPGAKRPRVSISSWL